MSPDPLATISAAVDRQRRALEDRDAAMLAAREAGQTWQAIADAAGMTPHGVRYALNLRRRGERFDGDTDAPAAPESPSAT